MTDTTQPPVYTYTIMVLSIGAGSTSAPFASEWQVDGSYVHAAGEYITITDADGNTTAVAPLGAVVTRSDATKSTPLSPAPAAAAIR